MSDLDGIIIEDAPPLSPQGAELLGVTEPRSVPNPDAWLDGSDIGGPAPADGPRRGRPPRNTPLPPVEGKSEADVKEPSPFLTISGRARKGALVKPLTQMYAGIGAVVVAVDPICGQAILSNAEQCAKSLDELAQTNPAVARVLAQLVTTSGWATVVAAHAPILLVILSHHVPAFQRMMQERMAGLMDAFAESPEAAGAAS